MEDIKEQYEIIKSKNEELLRDITKLKEFINSCNIPLSGKSALGHGLESSSFSDIGLKLTHDLLIDHKKAILEGFVDIFSSFFGGARAGGGAVSPGKSYLVGERGQEIFKPISRGNIQRHNAAKLDNKQSKIVAFQENETQAIRRLLNSAD